MKQTIPVAILVRVSSSRQENARQIAELMQYANSKGYSVIETCRETISGAADADERHGLKQIKELAEAGKIRKVLTHEVSRIARRNSVTHHFIEKLEQYRVSVYWHAQGIETLLPRQSYLSGHAGTKIRLARSFVETGLFECRRIGSFCRVGLSLFRDLSGYLDRWSARRARFWLFVE